MRRLKSSDRLDGNENSMLGAHLGSLNKTLVARIFHQKLAYHLNKKEAVKKISSLCSVLSQHPNVCVSLDGMQIDVIHHKPRTSSLRPFKSFLIIIIIDKIFL